MNTLRKLYVGLFCALIMIFTVLITETYASVEYHNNGNPSKIVTDKGTITYYLDGQVESIVTPEGTAEYNLDGKIESIVGNPSISLEEAKAELKKLETTNNSSSSDTTLPNTGIENSYLYIIPVLVICIVVIAFKLKKLND